MFEAKYRRYITKSQARFAEPDEIRPHVKAVSGEDGKKAAGVPLYHENGTLYVDDTDNHTMGIGPTGCKKTRTLVYSTVASIIEAKESAVINDPKGEIYRNTAKRAIESDMNVFVLNFRNPSRSHFWNPMSQSFKFREQGMTDESIQCVNDFAETIVAPAMATTKDTYWETMSKQFLVSLTLMLMESVPAPYYNLTNLIPMCYEENSGYLKNMMKKMDPTSTAAFGLHGVLDLEAERTKSCIFSTLLSILGPFAQNQSLLKMLSGNSFEMESLAKTPTLIYIIYPDEKENLSFLVNLFFTQCYETLVTYAASCKNDRLPIRVNFILEEFSNLPKMNNFDNRISEARSKNIRYFLFLQSFGQLKDKYRECAETILTNCNNWICFSSKDMDFLNKISEICGKEVDYNGIEHYLISPFTMQHLRKGYEATEVLIVKQGLYPFITSLPDFSRVEEFKGYEMIPVPEMTAITNAKFITFDEWIKKINAGEFEFPFYKGLPKAS